MKMSDGLHAFSFTDPVEELVATVSGDGSNCFVEPPGIMLMYNEEKDRYDDASGFPRVYPMVDGFLSWRERGSVKNGTWY